MGIINRMERKFGKYAIHNLMKYVMLVYAAGFIIDLINPYFYSQWLMLDIDKLLQGQIWRLVTFVIQPMESNILFMVLMLYVYFMIGNSLERAWGSFRFNVYYFSGVLFNILAVVIIYVVTYLWTGVGISYPISLYYINMSMFLAFATLFPDLQFYIMFLIPVKAKFLAIFYVVMLAYDIINAFRVNKIIGFCVLVSIVVSMANFFIMFISSRNMRRVSPQEIRRKQAFKREVKNAVNRDNIVQFQGKNVITRHKCAICGRTELDDENLEFRFCSKCDGNYEYCSEHLYTHEHVKNQTGTPPENYV